MQRHRFYAHPTQIEPTKITLDAEEAHHLSRVLRITAGDAAFVFDGEGSEYECEVLEAGRHAAELRIIRRLEDEVESPLQLTLAQALIKGDKFDWVVQKAVELGVHRIAPLIADHSERWRAERGATDKRLERWRRIALEAVKQSGRRRLVEIAEPAMLAELGAAAASTTHLLCSERGGHRLAELAASIPPHARIHLYVGPEGGWSDDELRQAAAAGFRSTHLGPRILRTETAGIAAVALVQHLLGDLR